MLRAHVHFACLIVFSLRVFFVSWMNSTLYVPRSVWSIVFLQGRVTARRHSGASTPYSVRSGYSVITDCRKIKARSVCCLHPVSPIVMSSPARLQKARKDLFAWPPAHQTVLGGVLPPPDHDPHPDLTLNLHFLWRALQPLVRFNPVNGLPEVVLVGPNDTPLTYFRAILLFLVSLSFCAQCDSSVLIL